MHFILLKYIHNIMRYMCFYKNRLNLPRSPLHCTTCVAMYSCARIRVCIIETLFIPMVCVY